MVAMSACRCGYSADLNPVIEQRVTKWVRRGVRPSRNHRDVISDPEACKNQRSGKYIFTVAESRSVQPCLDPSHPVQASLKSLRSGAVCALKFLPNSCAPQRGEWQLGQPSCGCEIIMFNDTITTESASPYVKIPNSPGLYRHTESGRYHAVKKINGKRRERSLRTGSDCEHLLL